MPRCTLLQVEGMAGAEWLSQIYLAAARSLGEVGLGETTSGR